MRRHRRTLGIPLILAAFWLARYSPRYLIHSVALVTLGETIRIWAAGHLRKQQVLTTGGPYRFIRNPLYLGSFLIAIGFCLIANSTWVWLLVIAYFVLCYIPVIRQEESVLRKKFPVEYSVYSAVVPGLYPTMLQYPNVSTEFSWRQVRRNKEYNAVVGILVAYAYLIFRVGDLVKSFLP
jgi:protein-S-isoprenylcysteine O-methyltransferase Ste14